MAAIHYDDNIIIIVMIVIVVMILLYLLIEVVFLPNNEEHCKPENNGCVKKDLHLQPEHVHPVMEKKLHKKKFAMKTMVTGKQDTVTQGNAETYGKKKKKKKKSRMLWHFKCIWSEIVTNSVPSHTMTHYRVRG